MAVYNERNSDFLHIPVYHRRRITMITMMMKLRMVISQRRVVRSTSCLFLGWGLGGRRIERRHFRSDQIQDGGRRPFWKTRWPYLSDASSYRLRVWFYGGVLGAADRTAPLTVVSGSHFVNSHGHIFQPHFRIHVMYVHRPCFALGLYNDCWHMW